MASSRGAKHALSANALAYGTLADRIARPRANRATIEGQWSANTRRRPPTLEHTAVGSDGAEVALTGETQAVWVDDGQSVLAVHVGHYLGRAEAAAAVGLLCKGTNDRMYANMGYRLRIFSPRR